MQEKWIFINATTHRSGSTFMQRVINACSKAHIWGETNIGVRLLDIATVLQKAANRGGDMQREDFMSGNRDIWMAHMCPSQTQVYDALRIMMHHMYNVEGKRVGLKDLYYSKEVIQFMARLFPDARFLFVTRNPVNAYLSYKNTNWPDKDEVKFLKSWTNRSLAYKKLSEDLCQRAMFIRYEDVDMEKFRNIYDFLDLPFERTVEDVINNRVGGSRKSQALTDSEAELIRNHCADAYKKIYGTSLEITV